MADVKQICETLLQNKKPIVIVGPDCSDKNKLRVYSNGGLLGKIYAGTHPKGKSELLSEKYDDYYPKTGALRDLITRAKTNNSQDEVLISSEYLDMAIKAIEERFELKKKDGIVQTDNEKERHVETEIVKQHMNRTKDWAVIDMEAQFSHKWFPCAKFSKKTTKAPRFDLIVINEKGIGIIELKVNNENCGNMKSHYEHMEYVLTHPKCFHDEFVRRVKLLKQFELVNEDLIQRLEDMHQGDIPLWCGFLFVRGGKAKAQSRAKELEGNSRLHEIQFMYYDDDIAKLDINQMVSYAEFVK